MYAQSTQFSKSQGHIPHACIGMKVVFMNGTQKWYYSYDANFQGKREYHNQAHWIKKFQDMCEFETPKNWKEYRVLNAGMFEMFQGKLGDKIGQFDRGAGWEMKRVAR